MKKRGIMLGTLLLCLLSLSQALHAQRTFSPELIANLMSVSQAAVSPNGSQIAYTVYLPGGDNDKVGTSWTELNVTPYGQNNPRKLISKPRSASAITWAPDSKSIYFMARREEANPATQIYNIALDGGEARMVSAHPDGVSAYFLSPDGKTIAFLATDGKTAQETADEKAGKDWIIYGENQKYTRIYLLDVQSGNIRKLFNQNLNVITLCWAPDGKSIVFAATETTDTDATMMFQKIYKVDVANPVPAVLTKTEGKLGNLGISPDGKYFAWMGAVDITDPLAQSLFVMPMAGGAATNLTLNWESSVSAFQWVTNEEVILELAEGCYTTVERMNTVTKARTRLYEKGVIWRSFSAVSNGTRIAVVGNAPTHPSELFTLDVALKKPVLTRQTITNGFLQEIRFAKQEVIEWTGPGGMRIEGILTYPLDYVAGNKYPLLLQIHGGPEGVSQNGFNTRAVYPVQWYAANGYFVLEPNYRGSMGRGVAFTKADHKDLGGKEYEDVIAGIDHLVAKGMVDNDKVGTGGFSYGGYFSALGATKYSNRFKASVMGAGIFDWISFMNTTDIVYENSYVHWNLWWWDHMDLVMDRSPIAHINNCKTPTLVIHGEKDLRVPLSQGEEMYYALKTKGVPVSLVVYKRQPHGIRERAAAIDYMHRTLGWFDKYVKGTPQH